MGMDAYHGIVFGCLYDPDQIDVWDDYTEELQSNGFVYVLHGEGAKKVALGYSVASTDRWDEKWVSEPPDLSSFLANDELVGKCKAAIKEAQERLGVELKEPHLFGYSYFA